MIKAKKSLGQNFLIDENIIEQITKIVNIENKNILEVGPGTGNLTSAILKKKPYKLTVIEKDEELVNFLKKKFSNHIQIINKDILDINENFLANETFTVFGNLPYNISTEILSKWILNLEIKNLWFDYLVLMFQKEVAERIVSDYNSKNYGRLTILTNWKLEAKKIIDIRPTSFSPRPKIESSVILFKPKKKFFKLNSYKSLEKITRIFFMHRRKMIRKPYNQLFNGDESISIKHKINLNLRPQNLNFNTYFKLAEEYEKIN